MPSPPPRSVPRGEFIALPGPGAHRLEFVMGMPLILDICDSALDPAALDDVLRWFEWVDATFSTYRPDSTISRLNRGQLAEGEAHPAVWRVLARCEQLRLQTGGYFDIRAPYRTAGGAPEPGRGAAGSVEPSGYVKGWAVVEAVRILERAGARNFAVNAGGDIHLAGHPDGEQAWRVGVENPLEPGAVALTLGVSGQAIATSGAYARGAHIVDPRTSRPVDGDLLSVTITGPDLATADAYATAVFAMGVDRGAAWCAELSGGFEAILICADETVLSTPGMDRLIVAEASSPPRR